MSLGEFDTYVDIRIKARVDGKLEKPAGTFNQYAKTHLQGAHIAKEVYEVLGRPNLFKDVLKVTLFAKVKPLILETRPQNTPPQNLLRTSTHTRRLLHFANLYAQDKLLIFEV